jgi:hypothetical protein
MQSISKQYQDRKKNGLTKGRMESLSELAGLYADTYCPAPGPVDPVIIAKAMGLGFSAGDYGAHFDGCIEYREGEGFHIFLHLNAGEHLYRPRVRFSFAHELGHYLIDSHRKALQKPGVAPHGSMGIFWSDISTEREADYFAAELLLPEDRFQADTAGRRFSFSLVAEISDKYNLSKTATLLRFVESGNHPLMLVCSRKGKKAWLKYSEDFRWKRLLLKADKFIPEGTAAGEFFETGTRYTSTQRVFAEDWFVLNGSADRSLELHEHCVYYEPLDQVVSVIWE